jgi:glycosyltransferase involved in cell wall biosynthesis
MRSPASVLIVTDDLRRNGGTAAHVAESAGVMRRAGYRVCVAADKVPSEVHELGYQVVEIPGLAEARMPSVARCALYDLLVSSRADVVHGHAVPDMGTLVELRQLAPVIFSVHNYDPVCMSREKYFSPGHECFRPHGPGCFGNALFRGCDHRRVPRPTLAQYASTGSKLRALRRADLTIAYSNFVGEQLRINRVPRVEVVPLFVSERARSAGRREKGRILFSGRVVPQKGLEVLLRALVRLPAASLDICGDGWGRQRTEAVAHKLGIDSRVRFHGWCDESRLGDFYQRASVTVVPSIWPEPFGLVGIEAMQAGCPVVASDTGGVREWLTDRRTGRLVPPGDIGSLSTALAWVLSHETEAAAMGRLGAQDVAQRFSPDAYLRATSRAYDAARRAWVSRGGDREL